MSIKVMTAVWEHAPVRGGRLLVLLALADYSNDSSLCWPSIPALARKSRLTERQVYTIIADLERKKLIEIERGTGVKGGNFYRVKFFQGVNSERTGVKPASEGGEGGFTRTVRGTVNKNRQGGKRHTQLEEQYRLEEGYRRGKNRIAAGGDVVKGGGRGQG